MGYRVLTVPGWHGSGPGHWQTIWETEDPDWVRIQQRDWAEPRLGDWVEAIESEVAASSEPVIFAAHSLGSLAVARWAERSQRTSQIAAGFLVAPPWLTDGCNYAQNLREFFPAHAGRLPFASFLVASQDDPYIPFEAARWLSEAWGSELVDAGPAGHINVQSGHGEWPEGRILLQELAGSQ